MMTKQRVRANDTGLPLGVVERLASFARETGTAVPGSVLDGEGEDRAFSDEFLSYCATTGLSLDWVWFGCGARTWSEERA